MVKIVTLFLIGIVALAVFGRLRFPKHLTGQRRAAFCPDCGRPRLGKVPCACGGKS